MLLLSTAFLKYGNNQKSLATNRKKKDTLEDTIDHNQLCEYIVISKPSTILTQTPSELNLTVSDKKRSSAVKNDNTLKMTAGIVSSFVSNNAITAEGLPDVITSVHKALNDLIEPSEPKRERPKPAVPVSRSVTDDHIVCLEDGKKLKMLRRYLRSRYDMSPDDYRTRWDLPANYPMVAPSYAAKRSEFAKKIGLGRGGRAAK